VVEPRAFEHEQGGELGARSGRQTLALVDCVKAGLASCALIGQGDVWSRRVGTARCLWSVRCGRMLLCQCFAGAGLGCQCLRGGAKLRRVDRIFWSVLFA
jgi:hypothetical protein